MNSDSLYKSEAGEKEVKALYDTLLTQWTMPHENINVGTRQGNTFVIASGDKTAPVLILLHGTDSNSLYWLKDIFDYSQFFRVYAIDAIGGPGRSAPNRPSWDSPAYREWMEDIWNVLQIKKASILGLSQGGWIALEFAISKPESVDKMVLLAPAGIVSLRRSLALKLFLLALLGQKGFVPILRVIFGRQPVPQDTLKFSTTLMRHFISPKRLMPVFTDGELRRLTMPTLLLVSKRDAFFDTKKSVARLKTLIPCLQVIVLSDAGHSLYGLTDQIIPFLRKK